MKPVSLLLIYLLLFISPATPAVHAEDPAEGQDGVAIEWQKYLSQFDLKWQRMPKRWHEAPFLGNGEQGTLCYQVNDRTIRFDVGCSAAHDHRPFDEDDLGEKHVEILNRGRLTIGHLRLELPSTITRGTGELDLWNAQATGALESDGGRLQWKSIVHAVEPVLFVEVATEGDQVGSALRYVPERAQNPRAIRAKSPRQPPHPAPVLRSFADDVRCSVQDLAAGGQTAVAWKTITTGPTTRLWLSVQHSYPGDEAVDRAVAAVRRASQMESQADHEAWIKRHQQWWHAYYPASFLSTGDAFWDSFYWVQQYKIACMTRDEGWIIDNQGPWLQPTAWNGTWWNLNAQLSHLGGYQANRRGMVSALRYRLGECQDSLIQSVAPEYRSDSAAIGRGVSGWDLLGHAGQPNGRPQMDRSIGRECGNLLWALHNVDLEYRYWGDTDVRDEVLLPLLIRAVNYYRHFLYKGDEGRWHLPTTYSPEYRSAADCTYDLDLLRWAAGRLIELSVEKKWDSTSQALLDEWQEIHENLVPVYTNDTGRMIGRDVALTSGHRHWSHLMAVYPLRTLTPTSQSDREMIQKSLGHWRSFNRGIAGYAHTGSAVMAAILGDGDQALEYLNRLRQYLHANTMYSEIGLPVAETPLHGATAMQEMVLQSWGGRLRLFPAVPDDWPSVQFANFRAEGGYLISAARRNRRTAWVKVRSTRGGTVEIDPSISKCRWEASENVVVTPMEDGKFRLLTTPGSRIQFFNQASSSDDCETHPVTISGEPVRFGLPLVGKR